jgi:hypothetical protein
LLLMLIPVAPIINNIMIVNGDSNIINKFEASLTDDARVVMYDHRMFIVQVSISPTFYEQLLCQN